MYHDCGNSTSTLRATHLFMHVKTTLATIGVVAQEHNRIVSVQMKALGYF